MSGISGRCFCKMHADSCFFDVIVVHLMLKRIDAIWFLLLHKEKNVVKLK